MVRLKTVVTKALRSVMCLGGVTFIMHYFLISHDMRGGLVAGLFATIVGPTCLLCNRFASNTKKGHQSIMSFGPIAGMAIRPNMSVLQLCVVGSIMSLTALLIGFVTREEYS